MLSGDEGYGVAALPDESVLVTGSYRETAKFGPGEASGVTLTEEPPVSTSGDAFVARYNADGSF